jgi:hypothetical protein
MLFGAAVAVPSAEIHYYDIILPRKEQIAAHLEVKFERANIPGLNPTPLPSASRSLNRRRDNE